MSHPSRHIIKTIDNKEFNMSSLHHQLIDPTSLQKDKFKVFAWAENLSPYHKNGDNEEVYLDIEPEIVYYPGVKGLGWQGHPEQMDENSPAVKYCQDLLTKFLNNEL